MKRVAAIVEGYGDVQAMPTLVTKAAAWFGQTAVAPNPIRAGEWKSLRRPGQLEGYLELALSRGYDMILVVLDLEDECAASEAAEVGKRLDVWKNQRPIVVEVVFMVREYEALFLACPSCLGSFNATEVPCEPEAVRGAKERVKAITGRRYKETQDQLRYTQALDNAVLYRASRSYRRLCKAISGVDYDTLALLI